MSVANTLKGPIVAPAITIQYAGSGGGPSPGLFLPLAGGTMDASPSGVINAHTITGLTTLQGDAVGNDLSILAQAGGANVNIDTTASGGDVNIDTGAFNVNASEPVNITTAGAFLDLICPTGELKAGDPLNVGNKALIIINNTSPQSQIAVSAVDNVAIDNRIVVVPNGNMTYVPDDVAVRMETYINTAGNQTGLAVGKIVSSVGNSTGINVADTNAELNVIGVNIAATTSQNGNAVGCAIASVNGPFEGVGLDVTDLTTGAAAYGVRLKNINASSAQAVGFRSEGVVANGPSRGAHLIDTQSSGDSVYGLDIAQVTTDVNGVAYGINTTLVSSQFGSAIGHNVETIGSTQGGAFGVNITGVSGKTDATGISVFTSIAANGPAKGIQVFGVDAQGIGLGNENATGLEIQATTSNPSSGMTSTGIKLIQTQGDLATGVSIIGVEGFTNDAKAIEINSVNSPAAAFGVIMEDITADASRAIGYSAQNVTSTNGGAAGLNINGVVGRTGANGILIENVSSSLPSGAAYGLLANKAGAKGLNDAGVLMRLVTGNLGLAVQTINIANANVYGDNGNFVEIGTTAATNVILNTPTGGWLPGHFFLFSKQGGGSHNLVNTGINFNGAPGPFAFGGPAAGMCLMFYTATTTGWAAHIL